MTGEYDSSEKSHADQNDLPGGEETILIVDDEEDLLRLAEQYLAQLGYRTMAAGNPQEALMLLQKHGDEIDLLFTDVVMPGNTNGYTLAEQAVELRPELKVLMTSGFTASTVLQNGQARFTAELLTKPYRKGNLAQRVRALLDQESAA